MFKLIIVDDEYITRDTISKMVDWASYGFELMGICKDGIDAYNMAIDELPDVMMTDIMMPGLNGLELIQELSKTGLPIQFIILSGYDEFEYARKAMKFGVKEYLLKPCNEGQIIESLLRVKEECQKIQKQIFDKENQDALLISVRQDAMFHLVSEGIAIESEDGRLPEDDHIYGQYSDLYAGQYYLVSLSLRSAAFLPDYIRNLETALLEKGIQVLPYGVCGNCSLYLFFIDPVLLDIIHDMTEGCCDKIRIDTVSSQGLTVLLNRILATIKRCDTIYVIHKLTIVSIKNNLNISRYIKKRCIQLSSMKDESDIKTICSELKDIVNGLSNLESIRFLAGSLCMCLIQINVYSSADAVELMLSVNTTKEMSDIRKKLNLLLDDAEKERCQALKGYGFIAEKIIAYVDTHLADQNLTLKKIAEEELYMNVDYVSRQFQKAMKKKFSQYLASQRIKTAKELLMHQDTCKIQYVALKVGCGNNTQYFSQLFKKYVGITPSKWAAQIQHAPITRG